MAKGPNSFFGGRDANAKTPFAYSRSRDEMSSKDKKALKISLGQFDTQTDIQKLYRKIVQNPRFRDSSPPKDGIMELISNTGFKGRYDTISLHQACHN